MPLLRLSRRRFADGDIDTRALYAAELSFFQLMPFTLR